MFFNSLSYLFFLPLVAAILYIIPGKYQWLWLLIASIFFYYALLPVYLFLFLALIILNYYLGLRIEASAAKRNSVFIFSVCVNIIVLAFFKYFGFIRLIIKDVRELSVGDPLLNIFLPAGLSFFIFTILSYLIEVKRGTIKAEKHLGKFASSLMFFPKILQGPIEKPGNIFPQFREEKRFNYDMVAEGLKLMLWGYFKKLVVADRLAIYSNAIYSNYEYHNGMSLLLAVIFYSFQIYADFSGYTDIALGSAKVLGFNLTNNFKRPYLAASVKEFWDRWHISFSVWLRDYLFLPLAFILTGKINRTKYLGIAAEKWIFLLVAMVTFAVCGIWHGEGPNYLLWGLLFGFYLTAANWTIGFDKKIRKKLGISKKSAIYRIYAISVTFLLVTFAWIFFRASNVEEAFTVIRKIAAFNGPVFIEKISLLIYSFMGIAILFLVDLKQEFYKGDFSFLNNKNLIIRHLSYASLIIMILLTGVFDGGQFIYFQF